jgi:hypothetical protein
MNIKTAEQEPANSKKPDFNKKHAKKPPLLREVAKALNYSSLDRDIPEFIINMAKKSGLIIVFVLDSYKVKILGAHDCLTNYQNTGAVYLRHNEFFIEPECGENEICRYFEEKKKVSGEIVFDYKYAGQWFCKTDIEGEYFNLMSENGDTSKGIVFHRDELERRFTDKELLDGLENIRTEHAKGRWTPHQLTLNLAHASVRDALTSFLIKNMEYGNRNSSRIANS